MKNTFYLTLKAPFHFKIFVLIFFGYVQKGFDKKNKVNFKTYDFTTWLRNNSNTHIVEYLKKYSRQSGNQISSVNTI